MKNYTKIKEEYIEQIQSKVTLYSHDKTKARVCTIENDDRNKVFSIAFRTAPINSTGLTHILEHSVLCGSKKYPVKDPFVELVKSSLNTFLNAFTFPDKTMYPCASQNDKDFKNLMSVYMDAVFYPQIYNHEEIFLQEGWRYDIKNPEDEIKINGVVYNEMKGAFSDPQQIILRVIMHSLYPDTPYGFESGGDPKYIPDLSYDEFLKFHSEFYHPSNSYILIYGDCDMSERMDWLDKEYLANFEYNAFNTSILYQAPFNTPRVVNEYYQIDKSTPLENKTFFSYNVSFPTTLEPKLMLAMGILTTILLDNPGAPLKQALIDNGIGDSIDSMFDDGLLQPIFSIMVSNCNDEYKEKFILIIDSELKKYVEEGLDHDAILSLINYQEFKAREGLFGRFPKGLNIEMACLSSWLYDDLDCTSKVNDLALYDELRESLNENYFEDIISKYLINSNHKSYVYLNPSYDVQDNQDLKLKEKLAEYKASLSSDELNELILKNKKLLEYQNKEDSIEAQNSLPRLELEDLSIEAEKLNLEVKNEPYETLVSDYFTNNICYIKYYFNIDHLNILDCKYLSLLTSLLSQMSTKKLNYKDMVKELQNKTGTLSFGLVPYHTIEREAKLYFSCCYSSVDSKLNDASELINDIIFNTSFDDYKRLKELISELTSNQEMSISSRGHSVSLVRASSAFDESSRILDATGGIEYLDFLKNIVNNFDDLKEEVVFKMKNILNSILSKDRFILGYVGQKDLYLTNKNIFDNFYSLLNNDHFEIESKFKETKIEEAIIAPYNVNYVARAGKTNTSFNGSFYVLNNALSMDYLWNEVRVHGGAYGCMLRTASYGLIGFTSYRDPEVSKTNDAYEGVINYIDNFNFSDDELLKFKIGAIGSLDSVLHPSAKGLKAQSAYLAHSSYELDCKLRKELINTTNEDIRALGKSFKEALEYNDICVLGNKNKIEEAKDLFSNIRNLIK